MTRLLLCLLTLTLATGAAAQEITPFNNRNFHICDISPGDGKIGDNQFHFTVENQSDTARPFYVSLRTEGAGNWQKGYYFLLAAHETRRIAVEYVVPDRSSRLLKAYFGESETMPTEAQPYPKADLFKTLLLAPEETREIWDRITTRFDFWLDHPPADSLTSRIHAPEADPDARREREDLRALLDWNRATTNDYGAEVEDRYRIGHVDIQSMRVQGEPETSISFLLMRPADTDGPLPTVLYLPGNPPGTRESGISKMMPLVEAGFQVASMDRRLSARHTDPGEFLTNLADPVFDARRTVDYLLTRDDVAKGGIGVIGYSAGAEEGQFLLALHDSVRVGVLVARPIDHRYLFESKAWWPTLYDPDILPDIGLGSLVEASFDEQLAALTPERNQAALEAYCARYPFFDKLNSTHVLSLAAPKPLLVITGARDGQFPLEGVLALDDTLRAAYAQRGAENASALYIMPRHGHRPAPRALDLAIDFFRTWLR